MQIHVVRSLCVLSCFMSDGGTWGSCLVLYIECDVFRVDVLFWHKALPFLTSRSSSQLRFHHYHAIREHRSHWIVVMFITRARPVSSS
jgi:hypothetical protein